MTKQLKPWDQYVADAQREPLEMPMPDGEPILIHYPTGGQIRLVQEATTNKDAATALFGEDQAKRLLALFESAPGDVLRRILRDAGKEFGVDVFTGNPLPSSD